MSQDIILHWYPESPFSHKIAWILNYKNVNYKKVHIPMVEPRPARRPLDAGYRKTPILQIKNHVYCDSKAIIHEIEKRFPEPSLYPKTNATNESTEGLCSGLNLWLEGSVFLKVAAQIPDTFLTEKFIQDRRTLFGATFDYDHLKTAAPYMKSELLAEFGVIQRILGNKTWVFDTNTLSLVDITVAMLVFFCINMAGEGWVKANIPTLHSFMERVLTALQWENTVPYLTEEEAVEVLKRYNPDYIGDKSNVLPIELGAKVLVTPLDTGKKNPASGKLVKSTAREIVIECKNDDFNTTSYVHFPTLEFIVMPDKCNSQ